MSTTTTQQESKTKIVLGAFGDGKFSPAMAELFRDTQRLLGFEKIQAHVTALRFGVDIGQMNKANVNVKLGKTISKNGERTLKGSLDSIKVPNTWALSIATVVTQLDDARKNGLMVVECTMTEQIMQFVHDAAAKVEVVEQPAKA